MTLRNEKVVSITPTKAFNITRWFIKTLEVAVWDAPGQLKCRETWRSGLDDTQVLMYVVDTSDAARFAESKQELDKILSIKEAAKIPLIICFNKMDLPGARENHVEGLKMFDPRKIKGRRVFTFDTTINDPASFNPVKDALVKILQNVR